LTTTDIAAEHTARRSWQLPLPRTPGAIIRTVLAVAVTVFLIYYVTPSRVGTTLLKVVAAVGISVGAWVGANLLFNRAYARWTQFATATGFVVGFLTFLALDGNRILRDTAARPWLWAVIGGVAVAAVMLAVSSEQLQSARLPVAVGGFAGLGVLLAVAVDESRQPALDWAKLLVCTGIGIAIAVGRRLLSKKASGDRLVQSALTGGGVGWLIGAWGGATFASTDEAGTVIDGGSIAEALVATVIPLAAIGLAISMRSRPDGLRRREIEQRSRSWIFLVPALTFILGGLLVPLVQTVIQSFQDARSVNNVGFDNYHQVITAPSFFDKSRWDWPDFFGSRLFWIAIVFVGGALAIGVYNGRKVRRAFENTPGTTIAALTGFFFLACLVLGTLRGSIINNLWWVITVTLLSTAFGLAVAVLADRAKGENVAKSLIFLPMAISFVGAGVIWRLIYKPKNINEPQSGVLNAIWFGLGQLSNTTVQKWIVFFVIALIVAGLCWIAWTGVATQQYSRAGFSLGGAFVLGLLGVLLVTRGLGFEIVEDRALQNQLPSIPDVVRDIPFNNMWLMVVLIWIQTGFAMVIFSSAIKAVPTEFLEAASIDGATTSQTFWKVTLPQLLPTIGVVVTTLIVSVMKVYDIIQVMTGGQSGTQVIAFQMIEQVNAVNNGKAATYATLLFVAILPVMVYNIRKMQKEA
jgi:alpha-glucoside transport system permease protein